MTWAVACKFNFYMIFVIIVYTERNVEQQVKSVVTNN